jgi:intein/homing endonuclease
MNKKLKYAYLAGFVDADGSISIKSQSKKRPYLGYITVYNCNKEVIEMFFEEFGGGKSRYKKTGKNWNKNWRPCWEWQLTAQKAARAIEKIYPYLVIKKRQATLVLELCKIKSENQGPIARWQPERWKKVIDQFAELKKECKQLNLRGVQAA